MLATKIALFYCRGSMFSEVSLVYYLTSIHWYGFICCHFVFHGCSIIWQADHAQLTKPMRTVVYSHVPSMNWCWLGAVISVEAHRCMRALRIVQSEHPAPQLYTTLNRRTCSSVSTPRITTHYTIHPRDKDPRWQGKTLLYLKAIS